MIEADALPDKEVLAGTRRGLPPVETVTTIRRPGRPADELANSRDSALRSKFFEPCQFLMPCCPWAQDKGGPMT